MKPVNSNRNAIEFSGKPWDQAPAPDDIYPVPGMLGDEERRALYWIAKNAYEGKGAIVDAGAFVGASAVCLAAGSAASGCARRPSVYSFDYFAAIDDYVVDFISNKIRPIAKGESYADVFQGYTRRYGALIEMRPGDFLSHHWREGAIEILFIDIAKTQSLNSHLVKELFPSLIVGSSIVIQQDFYHLWHPYIHITMEFLADYFDTLDERVLYQSRVYRYVRPIPQSALDRIIKYEFTTDEKIALLRRAAERSASPVKEMLEAIVVYQSILDKDDARFLEELANFERRHPEFRTSGDLWAVHLRQAIEETARRKQRSSPPQ